LKTLVFGARGQLGQTLRKTCPFPDASFLDREAADLADPASVERAISQSAPALVINAAAYTAVDRAETDGASALAINGEAPAVMARACAARGARLIHVSTDYVFDGRAERPYQPGDAPHPVNAYGSTKLAGERGVQAVGGLNYLILRTSWVYSEVGRNFFLTMLRLAREGKPLRVVADQVGTPSSTWTLADAIWRVAGREECTGIEHFTDGGEISWHTFAIAIFEEARAAGLPLESAKVAAITTPEYPTPAARPAYAVLDSSRLRRMLGLEAIGWRAALREVARRYAQSESHV